MSFLTRLLIVTLLVGSCIPQNIEDIILLTLETIVARQDSLLQKYDEMNGTMTNFMNEVKQGTDNSQEMLRKILQTQCQRGSCCSNCKEVLENGGIESGVYTITPKGFSEGVEVYCDQMNTGGGWTVILQRKRKTSQVNFTRSFEEYAAGFGNPNGEFWIGNRVLHSMTGDDPFTLRVDATGVEGQHHGGSRTGIWETFSVGAEDTQFTLSVGDYSDSHSTLGDAALRYHNNSQFSTYDRDNDKNGGHCSINYGKGGWWYNSCFYANPTAPLGDTYDNTKAKWDYWNKGNDYSEQMIFEIQLKIRP